MPRVPTKGMGGYVAQLKFVLPAHVQALGVRWVFVVLDDVRLFAGEFDAAPFFRIAARNDLDVASPAIRRAHGRRFPEMRPRSVHESNCRGASESWPHAIDAPESLIDLCTGHRSSRTALSAGAWRK